MSNMTTTAPTSSPDVFERFGNVYGPAFGHLFTSALDLLFALFFWILFGLALAACMLVIAAVVMAFIGAVKLLVDHEHRHKKAAAKSVEDWEAAHHQHERDLEGNREEAARATNNVEASAEDRDVDVLAEPEAVMFDVSSSSGWSTEEVRTPSSKAEEEEEEEISDIPSKVDPPAETAERELKAAPPSAETQQDAKPRHHDPCSPH